MENPIRQLIKRVMLRTLPRRALVAGAPPGHVCLTFDDGPHPEHTPKLLDTLAKLGVGATFFVIGKKAAKHPNLVARIVAEGHAIGSHSYDHAPPKQVDARTLAEETRRCRELLARIAGCSSRLMRPPFGTVSVGKAVRLWLEGQTIVLWSSDPKDYACRDADEVIARLSDSPPASGDIVLMHDTFPWAAEVLPSLVARLELSTVRDVL